jgi:hypothetical protein
MRKKEEKALAVWNSMDWFVVSRETFLSIIL